MCVGVTMALAPPTALVTGYYLWFCGQRTVLTRMTPATLYGGSATKTTTTTNSSSELEAPRQSLVSYTVGLATLGGTYLALDRVILQMEQQQQSATSATKNATPQSQHWIPHKAAPHEAFRPPQTVEELVSRLGPPLVSRLAAASVSFFCAGAVQTYVAAHIQQRFG